MIGILNRWRQFGRRYFWPHLLLGMVAASLGISPTLGSLSELLARPDSPTSLNHEEPTAGGFHPLIQLQEKPRPLLFNVNYWQQHALRIVIRHLSFALLQQQIYSVVEEVKEVVVPEQHLLSEPFHGLWQSELPHSINNDYPLSVITSFVIQHHPGLWLAQIQGIRAGPGNKSTLCCTV